MDLKRSVDLGHSDDMSKNDFSLAMLLRLGKISAEDLGPIEDVFFELDVDRSGHLSAADLSDLTQKALDNRLQVMQRSFTSVPQFF